LRIIHGVPLSRGRKGFLDTRFSSENCSPPALWAPLHAPSPFSQMPITIPERPPPHPHSDAIPYNGQASFPPKITFFFFLVRPVYKIFLPYRHRALSSSLNSGISAPNSASLSWMVSPEPKGRFLIDDPCRVAAVAYLLQKTSIPFPASLMAFTAIQGLVLSRALPRAQWLHRTPPSANPAGGPPHTSSIATHETHRSRAQPQPDLCLSKFLPQALIRSANFP